MSVFLRVRKNNDIRCHMKEKRVTVAMLASHDGVCSATVSKYLAKDLTPQKRDEIIELVNEIANERDVKK